MDSSDGKFIIVGGGGFGREVASWVRLSNVMGFLDDGLAEIPRPYPPLLGKVDQAPQWRGKASFLLAIGDPRGRQSVAQRLQQMQVEITTFIHRSAHVVETASLAPGCLIGPFANVSAGAKLGRSVIINAYSGAGHDAEVGEFVTMSAHVDVCGYVKLGAGVFLGSHASVLPKVTVGAGARIGAGAMVARNVPQDVTVYGPLAKKL